MLGTLAGSGQALGRAQPGWAVGGKACLGRALERVALETKGPVRGRPGHSMGQAQDR